MERDEQKGLYPSRCRKRFRKSDSRLVRPFKAYLNYTPRKTANTSASLAMMMMTTIVRRNITYRLVTRRLCSVFRASSAHLANLWVKQAVRNKKEGRIYLKRKQNTNDRQRKKKHWKAARMACWFATRSLDLRTDSPHWSVKAAPTQRKKLPDPSFDTPFAMNVTAHFSNQGMPCSAVRREEEREKYSHSKHQFSNLHRGNAEIRGRLVDVWRHFLRDEIIELWEVLFLFLTVLCVSTLEIPVAAYPDQVLAPQDKTHSPDRFWQKSTLAGYPLVNFGLD